MYGFVFIGQSVILCLWYRLNLNLPCVLVSDIANFKLFTCCITWTLEYYGFDFPLPGWTGESCSEFDCGGVNDCHGNGECIGTNSCRCTDGLSGNECNTKASPLQVNDGTGEADTASKPYTTFPVLFATLAIECFIHTCLLGYRPFWIIWAWRFIYSYFI